MGYRCRWQIVGRVDVEEPQAMTKEEIEFFSQFCVSPTPHRRLSMDVRDDQGELLGHVRSTVCGYEYRPLDGEVFIPVPSCNSNDPKYGRAVLSLVGE